MITKKSTLGAWIIIGVVSCMVGILAPLHEAGHWLFGAEITGWALTAWPDGTISVPGVLAGYGIEMFVVTILELVGAARNRKAAANCLRSWSIGYLCALMPMALMSGDFNEYIFAAGGTPAGAYAAWIVVAGPIFLWRMVVFVREYRYTSV